MTTHKNNGDFDLANDLFNGINDLDRKKEKIKVVVETIVNFTRDSLTQHFWDTDVLEKRPRHLQNTWEFPEGIFGEPITVEGLHGSSWVIDRKGFHNSVRIRYGQTEVWSYNCHSTPSSSEVLAVHADLADFIDGMIKKFPWLLDGLKPFLEAGRALRV